MTLQVKSLSSSSYYNTSKEQGNPSSYLNTMVETIDISSGSDTDFSWSSDDDAETDVQITGNSKPETSNHIGRKLPSSRYSTLRNSLLICLSCFIMLTFL